MVTYVSNPERRIFRPSNSDATALKVGIADEMLLGEQFAAAAVLDQPAHDRELEAVSDPLGCDDRFPEMYIG